MHPYDLFIVGELTNESVLDFQIALRDAHEAVDEKLPIRINLSCDGGPVELGLAIVSQIHEYRRQGRHIITHANSGTYSGGTTILMAGTHRTMDEYALLMIHEPQISVTGWDGTATDFAAYSKAIAQTAQKNIDILVARTGHQRAFVIETMFNANDNYFDAGVSLELALVDEIIYAP